MTRLLRHISIPIDAPFLDQEKQYYAYFIDQETGKKTALVESYVNDDGIVCFLFDKESLHNFEDGDVLSLVFFDSDFTEGKYKRRKFRVVDMKIPENLRGNELLPMLVPDDVDAAIAGTPSGQDASELEIANTEIDKVLAGTSVAQDDDEKEISNSEIDSVIN